MKIVFQIEGLERLQKLTAKSGMVGAELRKAFDASGFIVESEAKKLAPKFDGLLANTITHEVDPAPIPMHTIVGVGSRYAKYVHAGRKPGKMPPVKALERWAKKKGLNAWAVAKSIEKKGIKPKPFLTDALEAKKGSVVKQFDNALERIRLQWHN